MPHERKGNSTKVNLDKVKLMKPTEHDDIPEEIDFSGGERGKFYRKDADLQLPIHLEASVQNTLAALADARGVDLSVFVNELLKKDIELMQMAKK